MASPGHIETIVEALEVYQIERPLGTGGMGTVHLLKNRLTGRHYAGKVCILPNAADQRLFLEELRVWIDLPAHPHLAACYFFRTVDDRVLIFAEYLAGGSMTDVLRSGGLQTTEQILNVAIQSARGLRALHERGLVHGDVKPGNVLLSGEAQVKVADFGLAFSRRRIPQLRRGSNLYRSPEQLSETITPAADVWSWGLTVLEMFTRQPNWGDGNAAPIALKEHLRHNGNMPPGLAAILKKCFEWKPERRWQGMAEIEAELLAIHQQATGNAYPQLVSPQLAPPAAYVGFLGLQDTNWPPPQTWLEWLWEQKADGGEAPSQGIAEAAHSRTAQALSDLIAYEDVLSAMQAMAERRPELKQKLAPVYLSRGFIFQHLHDDAAASQAFDEAVAAAKDAPPASEDERVQLLATAWTHSALSLNRLGRWDQALAALEEAEAVCEKAGYKEGLVNALVLEALARNARGEGEAATETAVRAVGIAVEKPTGDWREMSMAAAAESAWGQIALRWGRREDAAEILESAIENYEKLLGVSWTDADVEKRAAEHPELDRNKIQIALSLQLPNRYTMLSQWSQIASLYCAVLVDIGRTEEGEAMCARGVEKLEALEPWHRAGFSEQLAHFYLGIGQAALFATNMERSVAASSKAAELYGDFVSRQGRDDLVGELGKAYANWSTALGRSGNVQAAIDVITNASSLFEAHYRARPSQETAHNWARILVNLGILELQQRRWQEAQGFFDRALELYATVRGELASLLGDIAWAQASRAYARLFLDDVHEAIEDLDASVPVMEAEAKRTGRAELVSMLDQIRKLWGDREWGPVEEKAPAEPKKRGTSKKWTLKRWFGK
ncbi:MAG TPA: serine/threonine-protein kinase [Bryobacteraceae bacterium]|nr:serine/threonine-protein kinase [Bryobacteraceae bacterium]